jgi:hypothetical protein
MTSAAMALSGNGHNLNPKLLNEWLRNNAGYTSQDLFVWTSINKLGLTFKGFITNDKIKMSLDAGNAIIVNVHNGGHWVLATGYSGDFIKVHDPVYQITSYHINEIMNGNTGAYSVNQMPDFFNNWINIIEETFLNWLGYEPKIAVSPIPFGKDDEPQISII